MENHDPSGRMQIRSRGELMPPASCYVCGNGTCDEGYLDFNEFIDYHGVFYLCLPCCRQVAEVIGFFSPVEFNATNEIANNAMTRVVDLETELQEANELVESINRVLASKFLGTNAPVVGSSKEESEPKPKSDANPFKKSDSGESVTEEPTEGGESSDAKPLKLRNTPGKARRSA